MPLCGFGVHHPLSTIVMSSSSQEVEVAVLRRFGIDVQSILAYLVGVLARRWNLDAATPVEVEVAELVGQIL